MDPDELRNFCEVPQFRDVRQEMEGYLLDVLVATGDRFRPRFAPF